MNQNSGHEEGDCKSPKLIRYQQSQTRAQDDGAQTGSQLRSFSRAASHRPTGRCRVNGRCGRGA
jgi:hypothetical protein